MATNPELMTELSAKRAKILKDIEAAALQSPEAKLQAALTDIDAEIEKAKQTEHARQVAERHAELIATRQALDAMQTQTLRDARRQLKDIEALRLRAAHALALQRTNPELSCIGLFEAASQLEAWARVLKTFVDRQDLLAAMRKR